MKFLAVLIIVGCGVSAVGQPNGMPIASSGKLPVILDTDMGNDIDDALALDMLMKYVDDGNVDLLGVMNNKDSKYSTRFLDLFTTWYGHGHIPIGQIRDGVRLIDYVDYAKSVVEMNDSLGGVYPYSIKRHDDLLESHKLYRKLLSDQRDRSVVIISVGFSTNLQRLLLTGPDEYSDLDGRALVAAKVAYLSLMGGSFGMKKRKEFNIIHDLDAARYVFGNWPTPIVVSPFELGASILYPASSIANDFGWADRHPLVDAYKHYRPFPYDRPSWDLTSVYYAVESSNGLLIASIPGILSVDGEGYMHFRDDPSGEHYYLSIGPSQRAALRQYFIELIKRKPKRYQN